MLMVLPINIACKQAHFSRCHVHLPLPINAGGQSRDIDELLSFAMGTMELM